MKIQNIQALRGIAVLSVVLFHLITIEKKYGGTTTILSDFFEFSMFGVDLFFVMSGFIMVVITREKFRNTKQGLHFLYHRISRIYPMYWIYSILVLGVFLANPSLVNSSQGNQADILASFLLIPSDIFPLLMVGWTLIHEMYFYLIFFLILLFIHERYMPVAILLWGMIIVFLNIVLEPDNSLSKLLLHPLNLEFIGGCLLAKICLGEGKPQIKTRVLFILSAAGLIALFFGYDFYRQMTGQLEPLDWWRPFIFGLPTMLLVFCFVNMEKNGFIIHSFIIKIGDASYSIYLSHILTLNVMGRLWQTVSSDTLYDNVIMIPLLLALTIIVGIASYIFIEKPILKLTRRII